MLKRLAFNYFIISRIGWRAGRLAGPASVIDGDTIVIAGERVRLHGIDAPELDQTFWCGGRELACGAMALAAIEALTAGVTLRCETVGRDRYGRVVAKCYSPNGVDIGRRLVRAGWALAYRRYAMDYVDAEAEARKYRRGLWRGNFTKPWEWRREAEIRSPDHGRGLRRDRGRRPRAVPGGEDHPPVGCVGRERHAAARADVPLRRGARA